MANQSIFSKTNAFHNKDDYLLKNKVFQKNADRRDAFREIVQDYPQMKNSIELNIKQNDYLALNNSEKSTNANYKSVQFC